MPKPWSKAIPDTQYDYIVIGSGMGGMVAAAFLTKLGFKVLVLEQHYVPGGYTHTFRRPGYEWDVGVHAVGDVTDASMTGRLLTILTDGRLEWASLGEVYDEFYFPDGMKLAFPDSPQKFRATLLEAFPEEGDSIDEYMDLISNIAKTMRSYFATRMMPAGVGPIAEKIIARRAQKYLSLNTLDVINSITDDERLRAVFIAQWGYYGSPPSRSSFAMQALVSRHFMHGGYYPVGGSSRIAYELLQTVADGGGWTAIRADAEEILVEGGRARGVRLKDGRTINCPRIVSAVGVLSTVKRLLPAAYEEKQWTKTVKELAPAPAHVCLYLGFEGDIRQAGCGSANKWFYETTDLTTETWEVGPDGPTIDAPCLYCSFPSLKNPNHDPGPEQRHTGEVVTFIPFELFEPFSDTRWQKRGEAYEVLKKKIADYMLEQFLKKMPELRPMIRHVELSTPASTQHFVRPVRGSIYGLEPTPARFKNPWLRPKSPIKGLYFGGADVTTVGVIGAMMGGVLAVGAAEPLKAFKVLGQASKSPRPEAAPLPSQDLA